MDAVMTKDEDLREKIKTFIVKLDKMEARVKEVETVAAVVPKLQKKVEKVETRVEVAERTVEKAIASPGRVYNMPATPPPVKAFVSGASIGLLIVGAIAAGWLLGFF